MTKPAFVLIITFAVLASSLLGNGVNAACQAPDPPDDGTIIGTPNRQNGKAFSVGFVIRFACNQGYGLAGADEAICQDDGSFSEDTPFCAEITCRRPQAENGVIVANLTGGAPPPSGYYRAGTTVTLRCNSGFVPVPPDSRTSRCQDSGQWAPNLAQCKPQANQCQMPPTPLNARVADKTPGTESTGFLPGAFIEYKCNPGYRTRDSEQIVCLIDGDWSEHPPNCNPIPTTQRPSAGVTCSPVSISNGRAVPQRAQYRVGSSLSVSCNDGFVLTPSDSSNLLCADDGYWSPNVGTCTAAATTEAPTSRRRTSTSSHAQCSPVKVSNGDIWPADGPYEAGTMVSLYCRSGYQLTPSDGDWSMCQTSGSWYPAIGRCAQKATTMPPTQAPVATYAPAPVVTGVNRPQSNQALVAAGSSISIVTSKPVYCSLPVSPPNTRVVLSRSSSSGGSGSFFSVGARLVYGCDEGFYLTDAFHTRAQDAPIQIAIECLQSGNWSNPPPTCKPNDNTGQATLDDDRVKQLFKSPYWRSFGNDADARYRACAWGGVAEILPDPGNRFQAIVICASGTVVAVSSNCSSNPMWKSVIGPPRGIVGWSQDPFYGAAIDTKQRQIYFTSSAKRLGILEANLDVVISAGLRGATIQPEYLVSGYKTGPFYEGITVDADAQVVYSADSNGGQVMAYGIADGFVQGKIGKPDQLSTFQPRHIALSGPGGQANRKLLATTDYANSQLNLFVISPDNFTLSNYVGTVASYSGKCETGSIGRPGDLRFDMAGNIIVADGGCGRVQIFAADSVTGRQPFRSVWASRNLGQYLGAVTPLLTNVFNDGTPRQQPAPSIMAGLSSGEVICYLPNN